MWVQCSVRVCKPARPLPQSLPDYPDDYGTHSALYPEDSGAALDEQYVFNLPALRMWKVVEGEVACDMVGISQVRAGVR